MVNRILVPLDGSPQAEQILAQVARLLRREDAEVILLRAADSPYAFARQDAETLLVRDELTAAGYLQDVVRTLSGQGVRARALVRKGPAAEAILQAAVDTSATLIAISTHGRSGPARWLLGSVAEKVLRSAPVPVLLRRSFAHGPQGLPLPAGPRELPFHRLLVPLDGSATSLAAVPAAAAFAKLFSAELDVLAVDVPIILPSGGDASVPTPSVAALPPMAAELAAKGVALFEAQGLRARALTATGDPATKILDVASAERADLIAMATHGWSGLTRWMLGSTAEKVLRHSTLPMLVVRPPNA